MSDSEISSEEKTGRHKPRGKYKKPELTEEELAEKARIRKIKASETGKKYYREKGKFKEGYKQRALLNSNIHYYAKMNDDMRVIKMQLLKIRNPEKYEVIAERLRSRNLKID